MLVEVVKQLLIVSELSVPLAHIRVPKVVAERNEKNRRTKETRFLTILIQEEESSERTDRTTTFRSAVTEREEFDTTKLLDLNRYI